MNEILNILKLAWAAVRWMLSAPAGLECKIWCPDCGRQHIDHGIWIYREHVKHKCHHCGKVFLPDSVRLAVGASGLPYYSTRGVRG